jgi:hypothetical protein
MPVLHCAPLVSEENVNENMECAMERGEDWRGALRPDLVARF